jgi:hypothetical protein
MRRRHTRGARAWRTGSCPGGGRGGLWKMIPRLQVACPSYSGNQGDCQERWIGFLQGEITLQGNWLDAWLGIVGCIVYERLNAFVNALRSSYIASGQWAGRGEVPCAAAPADTLLLQAAPPGRQRQESQLCEAVCLHAVHQVSVLTHITQRWSRVITREEGSVMNDVNERCG